MYFSTQFQKKVYEVVKQIPRGEISTYSAIAKAIGLPRVWRAVGNVLNKNRDLKIPCHRVIRSDGRIGGYREGTKKKIYLLKREGVMIDILHRRGVGAGRESSPRSGNSRPRTLRFSRLGKY